MRRLFSSEAGSNIGGDRRQYSACRVIRKKAILVWWNGMCVRIFGSRSSSSALAAEHSKIMGRQFLPMLLLLPGFRIGMIIALCHISGICPVEIDRLKMFVR